MKIMDKLDSVTENEIELCSKINHENIVRYFDHFHMSIEGDNQTFLITEYCQVNRYSIMNHLETYLYNELNGLERRFEETNRRGSEFG